MSFIRPRIYPYSSKIKGTKLTRNSPIEVFPDPKTVYISTSQHIGAPAIPVVNAGDYVKKGQLIAEANGLISSNIYASVSGTVREITKITNGLGQTTDHIIIDNDFTNETVDLPPLEDYSAPSLIERVRLAGIVGLGGAGFPTAVKLTPKNKLDTLVINGAECEPYLTCDFRLMLEKTDEIYRGIKYVASALGISNIVMGIELNKPEAIELFSRYTDFTIVKLKKKYPMGSEKQLIYCTTGRKVPTGKMPFDVGCCVQNIKTLLACYEAIEKNKPLTHSVITVSGKGLKNPKNLLVPVGTPYTELIEYCGGFSADTIKIVAGGPMMGKALITLNQFTKKADSGVLCVRDCDTQIQPPANCINCGKCAKNCPMRLMPMYIESFYQAGNYKEAERYGAMNCLECGLCAYNCPAKRALVQSISVAKLKIKEMHANGK